MYLMWRKGSLEASVQAVTGGNLSFSNTMLKDFFLFQSILSVILPPVLHAMSCIHVSREEQHRAFPWACEPGECPIAVDRLEKKKQKGEKKKQEKKKSKKRKHLEYIKQTLNTFNLLSLPSKILVKGEQRKAWVVIEMCGYNQSLF